MTATMVVDGRPRWLHGRLAPPRLGWAAPNSLYRMHIVAVHRPEIYFVIMSESFPFAVWHVKCAYALLYVATSSLYTLSASYYKFV